MSETTAIGELALKADKNVPLGITSLPDGREFIVHRNDFSFKDVTPPNKVEVYKPKLVQQAVQVQTVHSFTDYVDRFKNDDSMIFADIEDNIVLGVIDYHHEPELNKYGKDAVDAVRQSVPSAELCKHTVKLQLPYSTEWNTWIQRNNVLMSHKDFATFLEENAVDVLPLQRREGFATSEEDADMPDTLLELTRSLQVANKVSFNSVVRHGDYERVEFQKESDATAKGTIGLPLSFGIMIPVYFGEAPVALSCFIRKKVEDGILRIGYSMSRAENVRQDDFMRIVGAIAGTTELTTLFGTPS